MIWEWFVVIAFVILVLMVRIRKRGYFWKDKAGNQLTFRQFISRYKSGIEGITPLQQTITTIWSYIPIFGGLLWGIAVTLKGGTYWLSLILIGSLPITIIQFISNWQKYVKFKKINEE